MTKRSKTSGGCCGWFAQTFDMFGVRPQFNIDGVETYRSVPGAMCSILIFLVTALFAQYLGREFFNPSSELTPQVSSKTEYAFYGPEEAVRQDEGF